MIPAVVSAAGGSVVQGAGLGELVMVPAGYLAKRIAVPKGFDVPSVREICSVSGCVSQDFVDYVQYWRHNGYCFLIHQKPSGDSLGKNQFCWRERNSFTTKSMKRNWTETNGPNLRPMAQFQPMSCSLPIRFYTASRQRLAVEDSLLSS
jgi:hypothetical protein